MSEYQYYEFLAIDRSLTDRQMQELRAISTRAAITRTSFSNYYTFGDLKANPRDLLVKYFDASLDPAEHVALLSRVARGDGSVSAELMRRFRQHAPRPATRLPPRDYDAPVQLLSDLCDMSRRKGRETVFTSALPCCERRTRRSRRC